MKLYKDVRSKLKPEVLYGKEGEEVNVISEDGQVAIVENDKGDRFPVRMDLLTDEYHVSPKKEEQTKQIIKPVPMRTKKSKSAPQTTNSLFYEQ